MGYIVKQFGEGFPSVSLDELGPGTLEGVMEKLHEIAWRELMGRCPWKELVFSTRASNMLERERLTTIEKVCAVTRPKAMKQCGRTTMMEVVDQFATLGIDLPNWRRDAESLKPKPAMLRSGA